MSYLVFNCFKYKPTSLQNYKVLMWIRSYCINLYRGFEMKMESKRQAVGRVLSWIHNKINQHVHWNKTACITLHQAWLLFLGYYTYCLANKLRIQRVCICVLVEMDSVHSQKNIITVLPIPLVSVLCQT